MFKPSTWKALKISEDSEMDRKYKQWRLEYETWCEENTTPVEECDIDQDAIDMINLSCFIHHKLESEKE